MKYILFLYYVLFLFLETRHFENLAVLQNQIDTLEAKKEEILQRIQEKEATLKSVHESQSHRIPDIRGKAYIHWAQAITLERSAQSKLLNISV